MTIDRTMGVMVLAITTLIVLGASFFIQGDLNAGPEPDRCEETP